MTAAEIGHGPGGWETDLPGERGLEAEENRMVVVLAPWC